jgi:Flp pilus assembly protein TadG
MHIKGRRRRGERGAAAVEFALVSIPLFLLLFGIIQFGWAFYSQISISQAAREGARYASLQVPCSGTCVTDTKTRVINNAGPAVTVTATNITVSPTCVAGSTQSTSTTVTVHYQVKFALLFTLTLTGKASSPCGG